jgi:hypothetical protein
MSDFVTKTEILTSDKLLNFDTVIAFPHIITFRFQHAYSDCVTTSWSRIARNVMGFVLVTRQLRMAVYTA